MNKSWDEVKAGMQTFLNNAEMFLYNIIHLPNLISVLDIIIMPRNL